MIIYLHALFVGFVTTALAALLGGARVDSALDLHVVSLVAMILGLVMIPAGYASLGLDIAAFSSLALWVAGLSRGIQLVRRPAGHQ